MNLISLPFLTGDFVLFLIFFLSAFFFIFIFGRVRLVLILFSIYLSFLILNIIPLKGFIIGLQSSDISILKSILFVGLTLIFFLILTRSLAAQSLKMRNEGNNFWGILLLSLTQVGLILTVILSFFPDNSRLVLGSVSQTVFLSDISLLTWIILPIIVIFWIGKK
ncbi:hypothetical protein HY061_00055 [Candidatus Azambacteria bacterium]|nr:hypothetical protein [Candidatus Azambacteria bacterium]